MNAVEIAALTKTYGRTRALDDVSFVVEPGRVTALLGLNGAGKTTLFQILSGLFVADAGTVRIFGHDLARQPTAALARMGIVFQQTVVDLDLTVRQNLHYYAGLHGLLGRTARDAIGAALATVGLVGVLDTPARRLSGGMRRRLEIARALVTRPDLLLLDEPSSGLDAGSRADLVRDIFGLATRGTAVIWATHLVAEIEAAARVVVLHQGRVAATGTPADLTERTGTDSLEKAFLVLARSPSPADIAA